MHCIGYRAGATVLGNKMFPYLFCVVHHQSCPWSLSRPGTRSIGASQAAAPPQPTWTLQSLAWHSTAVQQHFNTFRDNLLTMYVSLEGGTMAAEVVPPSLKGLMAVAPRAFASPLRQQPDHHGIPLTLWKEGPNCGGVFWLTATKSKSKKETSPPFLPAATKEKCLSPVLLQIALVVSHCFAYANMEQEGEKHNKEVIGERPFCWLVS